MERVPVAVVGASGYSGIELLRILLQHPGVELVAATSRSEAGRSVADVFPRFRGLPAAEALVFEDPDADRMAAGPAAAVFLALPHGAAAATAVPLLAGGKRVIDLSADFRLRSAELYREVYGATHPAPGLLAGAVYGLPELRAEEIRKARLVASPGCYPTSVIVPMAPLLKAGLVAADGMVVASMSGVSGAGRSPSVPVLFGECNESVRPYGLPRHRHAAEIEQELAWASGSEVALTFVPHLVPVTAGIATTVVARWLGQDLEAIDAVYCAAYGDAPMVRLLGRNCFPDTRHVVRSPFIDIGWSQDPRTGRLVVMSAEDNLWKGASSQAVQSFNLMFGFPTTLGLYQF